MSTINLKWYLFAALDIQFLNRPCYDSGSLIRDLAGESDAVLKKVLLGEEHEGVNALVHFAKKHYPSSAHYGWDPRDFGHIAVKAYASPAPGVPENEMVLTRDTLYVPWPFFSDDTSPDAADVNESCARVIATLPAGLPQPSTGAPHVFVHRVLNAADMLAVCKNRVFNADDADIAAKLVDASGAPNFGHLGNFDAFRKTDENTDETYLRITSSKITIYVGSDLTDDCADKDLADNDLTLASYPCGALHGCHRRCPDSEIDMDQKADIG